MRNTDDRTDDRSAAGLQRCDPAPAGLERCHTAAVAQSDADHISPAELDRRGHPRRPGRRGLARAFPWLTGVVGATIAVPAVMHGAAVIGVAYGQRGGYDARLADLLWIGWTSLVSGGLMVAAVPALRRGSNGAFRAATASAAVFLVGTGFVAPVSPGFLIGVAIFGGYLLVALAVRTQFRHGHMP